MGGDIPQTFQLKKSIVTLSLAYRTLSVLLDADCIYIST